MSGALLAHRRLAFLSLLYFLLLSFHSFLASYLPSCGHALPFPSGVEYLSRAIPSFTFLLVCRRRGRSTAVPPYDERGPSRPSGRMQCLWHDRVGGASSCSSFLFASPARFLSFVLSLPSPLYARTRSCWPYFPLPTCCSLLAPPYSLSNAFLFMRSMTPSNTPSLYPALLFPIRSPTLFLPCVC